MDDYDRFYLLKNNPSSAEWELGIIILVLIIVTFVNFHHHKIFKRTIKSIFSYRIFYSLVRESATGRLPGIIYLLLTFSFILIFGLFIYQLTYPQFSILNLSKLQNCNPLVLAEYELKNYSFIFYIQIILFILLFYLGKMLVFKTSGIILKIEKIISEYLFNIFTLNTITAILLLVVTIIAYTNSVRIPIFSGLILILVIYILKIIRGIKIAKSNTKLSYFYFFLYLCVVEFLPFIFIIKYLGFA